MRPVLFVWLAAGNLFPAQNWSVHHIILKEMRQIDMPVALQKQT